MPGHEAGEYWIDVGIPQGSPLSPILFLFYAAPLLKDWGWPEATLLSYVDDTIIVVVSDEYERNNEIMVNIHEGLHTWAKANNLHFSPAKYHVMHFAKPWTKGFD
jgi:hypothetical protein